MNKRIKELAEQAGIDLYGDTGVEATQANLQELAELIVKECIDIVVEYSEDGAHCQRQMIKERFGVK